MMLGYLLVFATLSTTIAAPHKRGCAPHHHTAGQYLTMIREASSSSMSSSLTAVVAWGSGNGKSNDHGGNSHSVVTRPSTLSNGPGPTNVPTTSSHAVATSKAVETTSVSTGSPSPPAPDSAVGIDWNGESGTKISSFMGTGSKLGWYTNWALQPGAGMGSLEFVPQVWGSDSVAGVGSAASSWPSGTKHVLSFNERGCGLRGVC